MIFLFFLLLYYCEIQYFHKGGSVFNLDNTILSNHEIIQYEEIAMNAYQAIQSEVYDGWILRYTDVK